MVDARRVKGPARNRAVFDGVIALEHGYFVGLLLRQPVPFVTGAIGEAGGFTNAVVLDPIVVDVGLIRKGRPGTKNEGVLFNGLHGLGQINRHETARHFFLCFRFGVLLLATKVPEVSSQQFPTTHPPAVVIQIVVHQIGLVGIDAWVFGILVFGTIAFVILIKNVVIED